MAARQIVFALLAVATLTGSSLSGLAVAQTSRGEFRNQVGRAPVQAQREQRRPSVQVGSAQVMLPFATRPQIVRYSIIGGQAIVEEDIVLGRVDAAGNLIPDASVASRQAHTQTPGLSSTSSPLSVIKGARWRWPEGLIPYEIPAAIPTAERANILAAIQDLDSLTNLTFRVRTTEPDFISFTMVNKDQCGQSPIGMQGGRQVIELVTGRCNQARVEHEILHSVGAWHEQARSDRDQFVTVVSNNVIEDMRHNYDTRDGVDTGPYDFGSVMHYSATSFGITDANGVKRTVMTPVNANALYDLQGRTCIMPTIASPTVSQVMGQRNCLSAADIAGVNLLYPFAPMFSSGGGWGAEYYATQIALGDIDGDGRDEVAVARFADRNARVFVYDDATTNYAQLWEFGADWGSGNYATSVAFGNVDADGSEELAIARRSDENARVWVVNRTSAGAFVPTAISGTAQWGSGNYATDVAMGDVDADARDEIAVTRRTNGNARFFLFDDAVGGYAELASGGQQWGSGTYASAAALGDTNGDGREELAIGRVADEGSRYFVFSYDAATRSLREVLSGGEGWGSGTAVTDLAFGQIDGDTRRELAIVRSSNMNQRYFVLDDASAQFRQLLAGGTGWGSGNYATGVAFGDIDRDGRQEMAIARRSGMNERYWVVDDATAGFAEIYSGGGAWGSDSWATSVALGDVNGDGCEDLGVSRRATENMRFSVASVAQCRAGGVRTPAERLRDRVRERGKQR